MEVNSSKTAPESDSEQKRKQVLMGLAVYCLALSFFTFGQHDPETSKTLAQAGLKIRVEERVNETRTGSAPIRRCGADIECRSAPRDPPPVYTNTKTVVRYDPNYGGAAGYAAFGLIAALYFSPRSSKAGTQPRPPGDGPVPSPTNQTDPLEKKS